MPVYTYKCEDCDHLFETRQRMTAEPLTECPVCEGRVRRVVNSVGIVFKGSGFYVTDTRNGNGSSRAESSSVSKTASESSSSNSDGAKATESKATESKTTTSKTTESS